MIENLKRENKNLANEITDLFDLLGNSGKIAHEILKSKKLLEAEKSELQTGFEETGASLEQEKSRVTKSQLELVQVRQDVVRRLKKIVKR